MDTTKKLALEALNSYKRQMRSGSYGLAQRFIDQAIDILSTPAAADAETVPMPQNVAQARAMTLLGHAWLEEHAPHELKASAPEPLALTDVQIARALWNVQREHEDRCDEEVEDLHPKDYLWDLVAAVRAALAASQPAPVYSTTPEQNAEVDEKLGIELLPPIRVSAATAGIMKRFAALEGVILQAFVREVLEQRFTAGGAPPAPVAAPVEAQPVLEGWKLVPVKPTDEMVNACHRLPDRLDIGDEWSAMLAAAPTPSKGEA